MATTRPTFRITKNGYDRFSVDDAIEAYAKQVEQLEQMVDQYQKQLQQTQDKMNMLALQFRKMEQSMQAQKDVTDNLTRISIQEANEIISTAQKNADMIVQQALATARMIFTDLSKLYSEANLVKADTKDKLERFIHELDTVQLPKMPDKRWLKEAEKKLR